MTAKEIFDTLKCAANFEFENTNWGYHGFGAINMCPECKDMTRYEYACHYENMKKLLESLPWKGFIKNPYNPQSGEYPIEDGEYITMMDYNEHEVCTNTFHDGHFVWMNCTHIKWWMPLTDEMKSYIETGN